VAITIKDLAEYRAGKELESMADYNAVGLPMLGGCEVCEASIACYNAYPTESGYIRCADCVGDTGYETVVEANLAIFGEYNEEEVKP
jgi:hypothetical protein